MDNKAAETIYHVKEHKKQTVSKTYVKGDCILLGATKQENKQWAVR